MSKYLAENKLIVDTKGTFQIQKKKDVLNLKYVQIYNYLVSTDLKYLKIYSYSIE